MSRVFVALDTALDRDVVIKVLHPELAASVNADRFKREVHLSARLQHPHIVPVLTAGEVDGLPFYVMPFVKGESLRARLANGPLSVNEAVGILGDVAKALAYAHSEGVVHRDIKPDNVLLSSGAATVADFGIAKALSTARQGDRGETLTSLGTSLGTPAYMAPEQVAGDPSIDQRADIYSFGCVAYELLTGQPPFAGKSPQQLLAAHVMERPAPIAQRRAGLPPALAALVMRCLEKEPANRPQSASEIVAQLAASGVYDSIVPGSTGSRGLGRAVAGAAGALVLIAGVGFAAYQRMHRPAADDALHLAVAPFEVLDPQLALWKEGMVDVLSRNLDGAGPIRAVSPSVAIKKWEGRTDRASALAFGQRVGAQLVLYGQLMSAGRDLVDAKVWVLDTDRETGAPAEVQLRDSSARMDRVIDSLSVRVLGAISRNRTIGAARLASLGSGSLLAIKSFLQGAQFFRRTQWDSATASFRQAVSLDSTFGIAYALLGQSIGWMSGSGDAESQAMYRRAGASIRPGLAPRDSLMLTAFKHYAAYGRDRPNHATEARLAIAAAEAAATRYTNDPQAWYLLGDIRFHLDPTLTERDARDYFDRAIRADSDFAPAYIHAIELAYRYGRESGDRYVAAYLARNPRDVEAQGIRLAAQLADPAQLGSDRMRSFFDTLSLDVARKAYAALSHLPDSAEAAVKLLRAGVKRVPESPAKRAVTQMLIGQLAMRGHIDEAWALAVSLKHYEVSTIAGLGLVPLDSALRIMRPWLALRTDVSLYSFPALAAAHDSATLREFAAGIERFAKTDTVPGRKPIFGYVIASVRGYTALATGDTAAATRIFDELPDTVVNIPFDQFMRARLVGRQDPRRALELLERRQASSNLLYAARELERGRIAERLGEREKAVDAYAYVADVWAHAEAPALREAAKEARDALGRLDADGRMRKELGTPRSG
jgi:serine/threonine-protein kinase